MTPETVTISKLRCPLAFEHGSEKNVQLRRRANGTHFCPVHGDIKRELVDLQREILGGPRAFNAIVLAPKGVQILAAELDLNEGPLWIAPGVVAWHGDEESCSAGVRALDHDAAADLIEATWPGSCIDDLDYSADEDALLEMLDELDSQAVAS